MSYKPENDISGLLANSIVLAGSFGMGVTAVAATKTGWTKTGGGASTFDSLATASVDGTAGNSYDFALTDGGGPACAGTFGSAHYDAMLAVRSGDTGWTVSLQPKASGEIELLENATAKSLVVVYPTGVATRATLNAAINAGSSYIYVLDAGVATGALTAAADGFVTQALSSSPATVAASDGVSHVVCYYTNAVSNVGAVEAACNLNPAAATLMTFSGGTSATVLATADHFAATALSGGVDAVAIGNIRGKGFLPSKTGTGEYTITFSDVLPYAVQFVTTLQLASADDKQALVGTYDSSARTLKIHIWDKSAGARANVAPDANNRINFIATVINSGVV